MAELSPSLVALKRQRTSSPPSNPPPAPPPPAPPPPAPPRLPPARVEHESCIEGMKKLADASVHLVLADPPYDIALKGASWDNREGYLGFAHEWLAQAVRILRPGGSLLYFSSPCTIWSSRMNVMLADEFKLDHVQTLTWIYGQGLRQCTRTLFPFYTCHSHPSHFPFHSL